MEPATVEIDPTLFTLIIQFEVDASSGAAFIAATFSTSR